LSCAKTIIIGDPTPLICRSGLQEDTGLCYPFCNDGFNGVGPVCWQSCGSGQTDCGMGCAASTSQCISEVTDQVLSSLVIAANIATLGLSSVPAGTAAAVQVGNKWVAASTKTGRLMLRVINRLQTVRSPRNAILASRKFGVTIQVIRDVATADYTAFRNFQNSFATEFSVITSPEIEMKLDANLNPTDAFSIKQIWARIQLDEMAEEKKWEVAGNVLNTLSIFDFTGVSGVIAAYSKFICNDVILFLNV
jgi:hypothetical protein